MSHLGHTDAKQIACNVGMASGWRWQVGIAGAIFLVCVILGLASGPLLRATLELMVAPPTPAAAPAASPPDGEPGVRSVASRA